MRYLLAILFVLISPSLWGATVYVDPALTSDCDGSSYYYNPLLGTGDTCRVSGAGAKAYNTLQEVIWGTTNGVLSNGDQVAAVGDTVYLRAGTYQETYGDPVSNYGAAMAVAQQLNGTAWTAGNYTTISSYPGEWAILDANGAQFGFGYGVNSTGSGDAGTYDLAYIKFERLEITGATTGGVCWAGGPVWMRYCYVHDNGQESVTNQGGVYAYVPDNCIIEYCLFIDNADDSGHNNAHIFFFSDYNYGDEDYDGAGNKIPNPGPLVATASQRQNHIRYNYFTSDSSQTTYVGVKHKAEQYFDPYPLHSPPPSPSDYQEWGDKIHHNIFENTLDSVFYRQEFCQVYNNIADGNICGEDGQHFWPQYRQCVYNNTVFNSSINNTMGYNHWKIYDSEAYPNHDNLQLEWFCVNNIIQNGPVAGYNASIGIATLWERDLSGSYTYDWTNTLVDRNLIHNCSNESRAISPPNQYYTTGWMSVASFNSARSTTNYANSNDGLFTSGYITNPSFVIGSSTIAEGGYNAAHPYLSGVSIPKYVGAVNPSDSDWVAGVLGLATDSNEDGIPDNLLSATAGSDPTWIEGSESTPPSITGVMTGIIR